MAVSNGSIVQRQESDDEGSDLVKCLKSSARSSSGLWQCISRQTHQESLSHSFSSRRVWERYSLNITLTVVPGAANVQCQVQVTFMCFIRTFATEELDFGLQAHHAELATPENVNVGDPMQIWHVRKTSQVREGLLSFKATKPLNDLHWGSVRVITYELRTKVVISIASLHYETYAGSAGFIQRSKKGKVETIDIILWVRKVFLL